MTRRLGFNRRRLSVEAQQELIFALRCDMRDRPMVPRPSATYEWQLAPDAILLDNYNIGLTQADRRAIETWAAQQHDARETRIALRADPRAENESTADTCEVIAAYVGDATP